MQIHTPSVFASKRPEDKIKRDGQTMDKDRDVKHPNTDQINKGGLIRNVWSRRMMTVGYTSVSKTEEK